MSVYPFNQNFYPFNQNFYIFNQFAKKETLRDIYALFTKRISELTGLNNSQYTSGSSDFLNSNTLVAKFAFLLLIIFLFIIFLRVGISLLIWKLSPASSPKLINGMINAKNMIIFPQDQTYKNAVQIKRSINATHGIEFTWSVWIFIDNLQYLSGRYRHIFHKGNEQFNNTGLNFPNNAPGLYISPNTNALVVMMNTFNDFNEEIIIPNIPLNKWVNVIIKCQNNNLDIYINGTISQSIKLNGVPKQNYGDVFVAMNGGFDGFISNLGYYNYALGTTAISSLVNSGPNLKLTGTSTSNPSTINKSSKYLSLQWYFNGM